MSPMNVLESLRRLAGANEEEDDDEEFEPAFQQERRRDRAERTRREESAFSLLDSEPEREHRSNKVVSIHTTTRLQVVLMSPGKSDEFRDVSRGLADHLKDKRTVVLNLEAVDSGFARRILDFTSGVAYALGGRVQMVSSGTYLATPFNVEIVDNLMDELENNGLYL